MIVAVRVNYGQMPGNVHAFVGYIALAGAEGGLWSIEGGNFVLAQELIKLAQAKLVMKRVIGVKRDDIFSRNDFDAETVVVEIDADAEDTIRAALGAATVYLLLFQTTHVVHVNELFGWCFMQRDLLQDALVRSTAQRLQ